MFATIKSLIPEPRQMDHPRRYIGRHRGADTLDLPDVDGGPDVGDLVAPGDVDAPTAVDASAAVDTPTAVDTAAAVDASAAVDAETVGADAAPPERAA
jgi:hypothetical protein